MKKLNPTIFGNIEAKDSDYEFLEKELVDNKNYSIIESIENFLVDNPEGNPKTWLILVLTTVSNKKIAIKKKEGKKTHPIIVQVLSNIENDLERKKKTELDKQKEKEQDETEKFLESLSEMSITNLENAENSDLEDIDEENEQINEEENESENEKRKENNEKEIIEIKKNFSGMENKLDFLQNQFNVIFEKEIKEEFSGKKVSFYPFIEQPPQLNDSQFKIWYKSKFYDEAKGEWKFFSRERKKPSISQPKIQFSVKNYFLKMGASLELRAYECKFFYSALKQWFFKYHFEMLCSAFGIKSFSDFEKNEKANHLQEMIKKINKNERDNETRKRSSMDADINKFLEIENKKRRTQ